MTDASGIAPNLDFCRFQQQPLDLEIGFRRARNRGSQVEHGLLDRREPIDARVHQREGGASHDPVHKKKISKSIRVKNRDSSPLDYFAHSNRPQTNTAHHNVAPVCAAGTSEHSQHQREKSAHRIRTVVPRWNSAHILVGRFATERRA